MEALLKAITSLLSDVEGMQQRPQTFPEEFGPFSDYDDTGRDDGVTIDWPNLAISKEAVKQAIQDYQKVLVIDHQQAIPPAVETAWLASACPECGSPQFQTPSGSCCANGHGGL